MADEINVKRAKEIYASLCGVLDKMEWRYNKDEDKRAVDFRVSGEDIPMQFIVFIDEDRQLIRLMSPIPFHISKEKRLEGALAALAASNKMADGSFDYDLSDGRIVFRMTASYRGSTIGDGLFSYMILCACAAVDRYNDRFLALDKGLITLQKFLESDQ